MLNDECQMSNVECRMVVSLRSVFFKMDRSTQKLTTGRSTQKLTTGRIHLFDVRPARNAFKLVRGKFNNCNS
jgi:hypothetical protein